MSAESSMKADRDTAEFCATRVEKWLPLTRREAVIISGLSFISFLGTVEAASADSEFPIEVRPEENSANLRSQKETDQRTESYENPEKDIGKELGIGYRAPVCGMQNLTPNELLATGTPERPPGYLSVDMKSYFADNACRSFSNSAEPYLDTAVRKIAEAQADVSSEPLRATANDSVNDKQILMFPFGVHAVAGRAQAQALQSVEWGELLKATAEKAIDVTKGKIVEDIAHHVTGVPEGPVAFIISTTVDALTPTSLWEPELTYVDRLSPTERREFFNEVMQMRLIVEPPSEGPVLRNAP